MNWRTPARWSTDIDGARGLADVLRGTASLHEVLVPTGNPALFILPAGESTVEEHPIFAAGAELSMVLQDLDDRFDHVVLDLPALHVASEALTLAAEADAVAVVVRQGVTSEGQVKSALEQLDGVPVLGVILNAYSTRVPSHIMRRVPTRLSPRRLTWRSGSRSCSSPSCPELARRGAVAASERVWC